MKLFLTAISLALVATPALAQSRPFRLMLGGAKTPASDTVLLGLSVDAKRLPKNRMLSFYADSGFTTGFGCGTSIALNPQLAREYAGFESVGVSVRQPWKSGWLGLGVGSYSTHFDGCNTIAHRVGGLGGKAFLGWGGGLYFTEAALTLPSVTKYLQASISVGFRL